ncbi:MAG: sigma-70 family RNA polymerase sigma factor [Solirubrobacteraceae bacterium]
MRDIDDDDREGRFVRLYRDFQPKIAAYVRRRLPEPDAADALADTFLTAWRRLESVPEDPLPWLYRIAANSVANQRRSVRRWSRLQYRAHAWRELDSVRDSAFAAETSAALQTAWSRLTERDREVLRLMAWEGLDGQQLAAALGCSHDAARVRVHRARRRLAQLLDDPAEPAPGNATPSPDRRMSLRTVSDAND